MITLKVLRAWLLALAGFGLPLIAPTDASAR